MFDCSRSEIQVIDDALEQKLAWARDGRAVSEQMALDASRLLSCVEDRISDYTGQGFFKRCWFGLSGKNSAIERANQHDLLEMQKYAWRYISLLQERDLLAAQSIIAVKNNLLTLAIDQSSIKKEITRLADRVYDRFVALEDRVSKVEAAHNIHGWLLTIDTFDYDEKFPPHLRLLRVVSDFYGLKSNSWNMAELRYLQKAMKEVGLNPKEKITISDFVDTVIDGIDDCGYPAFDVMMSPDAIQGLENDFVIESVSAPSFSALYQIKDNYTTSSRVVKSLQKKLELSHADAVKAILQDFIDERGIDVAAEVSLKDLGTEILFCFSLVDRLAREEAGAPLQEQGEAVGAQQGVDPAGDLTRVFGGLFDLLNTEIPADEADEADEEDEEDEEDLSPEDQAFTVKVSAHAFSAPDYLLSMFRKEAMSAAPRLEVAAKAGNADAKFCLAILYRHGCGVDKEPEKAFRLLSEMQDLNDPDVNAQLGHMHLSGVGTPENLSAAAECFSKAAKGGNAFALDFLLRISVYSSYDGGASLYIGSPSFPEDKISNAVKSFNINSEETIFMLIDTTVFGSCDDGVAFGFKGIYWRNLWSDNNFIGWDYVVKFLSDFSVESDNNVTTPDGDEIQLAGSGLKAVNFMKILNSVVDVYRNVGPWSDVS